MSSTSVLVADLVPAKTKSTSDKRTSYDRYIAYDNEGLSVYDLSNPTPGESSNDKTHPTASYLGLVLDNVLTTSACADWVSLAEGVDFEAALVGNGTDNHRVAADVRDSGRCLLFSDSMATNLFDRLRDAGCLPAQVRDPYGDLWTLQGLNPRLSFLRYQFPDHKFLPHSDGTTRWTEVAEAGVRKVQSFFTVQLYLNDLVSEGQESNRFFTNGIGREVDSLYGGATRFFGGREVLQTRSSTELEVVRQKLVIAQCTPKAGRVALFDHRWVHEGQELKCPGLTKYTVRTDVLYARVEPNSQAQSMGRPTGMGSEADLRAAKAEHGEELVVHHSHNRPELDLQKRLVGEKFVLTKFVGRPAAGSASVERKISSSEYLRRRMVAVALLAGLAAGIVRLLWR